MGELLGGVPVEAARVRAGDDGAVELDLEVDVERPLLGRAQVREWLGILRWTGHPGQRVQRRHPGAYRRREGLAQERAERLVLPALDVARAPVVDEHEAEDVLGRPRDRDRLAELGGRPAGDEAQLELYVKTLGRSVGGSA